MITRPRNGLEIFNSRCQVRRQGVLLEFVLKPSDPGLFKGHSRKGLGVIPGGLADRLDDLLTLFKGEAEKLLLSTICGGDCLVDGGEKSHTRAATA